MSYPTTKFRFKQGRARSGGPNVGRVLGEKRGRRGPEMRGLPEVPGAGIRSAANSALRASFAREKLRVREGLGLM